MNRFKVRSFRTFFEEAMLAIPRTLCVHDAGAEYTDMRERV